MKNELKINDKKKILDEVWSIFNKKNNKKKIWNDENDEI